VSFLGHYAYIWRGKIVLVALLVAIAAAIGGASVFDAVKPYGFQDPDSESARATEALEAASGQRPLPDVVLVVEPAGEGAGAVDAAAAKAERELRGVPGVTRVVTPAESPQLLADDGRASLVVGYLDADVQDIAAVGKRVEQSFDGVRYVTAGGASVTAHQLNRTTENDLRRIELVAAPILFLLSLLVFRGLVAAALPLAVGLLSIVTTLLLLRLLTNVMEIDVFVVNIVIGLGLGLAIDYSLFVVSRFRDELEEGAATGAAARHTIGSTGRMILFSGLTVAVALASLTLFPQRFLYSIGVGGALVALTSAFVSLTVLPAMLSLLGPRVNALAPKRLQRRPSDRRWYGFGRAVLRHPALIAAAVMTVMVFLSLPALRVELTRADPSTLPMESSAYQVDAIVDKRFAGDPASIINVVFEERGSPIALRRARRKLARTEAVELVQGPARVGGGVRRLDAQLTVDPFTEKALDVVDVARELDWGTPALVNGPPAELTDQRESLSRHLPAAIAIIVVSTLLLLFVMTRSVVLPVLALLMNSLTVGVAFGVLVWVFQDGRLEGFLDYRSQGALDTSMPILLFAVVFGLSTDYGVFLSQRISEQRRSGDPGEREAIARGLAKSGRPITAAALLFAVAMGAFAFSDLVFIKEIAIGTALAVIVDATLVRALLFPALLGLLGARAWWAPRWLGGGAKPKPAAISG
jgi:RND superfamily putative drug exporter